MANVKHRPFYRDIEGILLPGMFKPEHVREAINYKPRPDEVILVTYPKCGTTWMQTITLFIFRKGEELDDPELLRTLCPFIDPMGLGAVENMPRPGAIKTHLPYTHAPHSPDAKYIYVLRNPKDCCVSMYYHTRRAQAHGYGNASFDDFFELFMAGEVEYNDYFDHLMSWYPHRNDKEVFFTTFEDMKKDTKDVVLKLATFLGEEYIDAIQKDNNVLNNILRFSGFDYMKKHFEEVFNRPPKPKGDGGDLMVGEKINDLSKGEKIAFIRKGVVGDWKVHFSKEQSERMNEKFEDRTRGTEIYEMYKSYMSV